MAGEMHELSLAIGELRADVRTLTSAVHDVRDTLTEIRPAVARLEERIDAVEPHVDDYRIQRERRIGEDRTRSRYLKLLWAAIGASISGLATLAGKLMGLIGIGSSLKGP